MLGVAVHLEGKRNGSWGGRRCPCGRCSSAFNSFCGPCFSTRFFFPGIIISFILLVRKSHDRSSFHAVRSLLVVGIAPGESHRTINGSSWPFADRCTRSRTFRKRLWRAEIRDAKAQMRSASVFEGSINRDEAMRHLRFFSSLQLRMMLLQPFDLPIALTVSTTILPRPLLCNFVLTTMSST